MALIDPIFPRLDLELLPTGTIRYARDAPGDPDWEFDNQIAMLAALHSLAAFVDYCWPVVHPGTPFKRGWHVDVLCHGLEQLVYGRVEGNELVLNIPPRMLKTIIVNVMFPAWVWLWNPSCSIQGLSGSEGVASASNMKTRSIILSDRYQRLLAFAVPYLAEHGRGPGEMWELAKDQNQKTRFKSTLGGERYSLASGAKITGEGCDLQIIDDLTDAKEATEGSVEQILERLQQDVAKYETIFSTRLNSPGKTPRVTIMQRLNEGDLAGALHARGVPAIVLPMEYDPNHPYLCPLDPRKTMGELLLPEHYGPAEIAKKKRTMGDYNYAAQFQQLPAPIGGGRFPVERWGVYLEPPKEMAQKIKDGGGRIYLSFDCAAKTATCNAWSVALLVGEMRGELYILAMYREQVELPELEEMYDKALAEWPLMIDDVLIEDASNGTALLQTRGGIAYHPQAHGGKETRAGHTESYHRYGRILLPQGRPWVRQIVYEHKMFPKGTLKDTVDALAQAAMHVRAGNSKVSNVDQVQKKFGWLANLHTGGAEAQDLYKHG